MKLGATVRGQLEVGSPKVEQQLGETSDILEHAAPVSLGQVSVAAALVAGDAAALQRTFLGVLE